MQSYKPSISLSSTILILVTLFSAVKTQTTPSPDQPTSTIIIQQDPTTVLVVATATTVTSSLDITTTTTPTTTASPQYTNPATFQISILNSTNLFRYEHNASFLVWNTSLASYAQSYAENCIWAHSHGSPGENLARGYPNVTSAIDAWGYERDLYNFTGQQTGFTEATGHFTQLVWKATRTVGCGAVDCKGRNDVQGWMFVCEYWPPGNVVDGASKEDANSYFEVNVQARVNDGTGFEIGAATAGVDFSGGNGTSGGGSNGATAAATTTMSSGSGRSVETGIVNEEGYGLRLCLMVILFYICAFM